VYQPNAVIGPVDEALWWNFALKEQPHFFSRWYGEERAWLQRRGIELSTPGLENDRSRRQQCQPTLMARRRLLLVIPERIDGEATSPHPLLGDLEACFKDLGPVSLNVDAPAPPEVWTRYFTMPARQKMTPRQLGRPSPYLKPRRPPLLSHREEETFSSLEALFYFPHQWVFRYQLALRRSSLLSIVPDHTLQANLAHRFIERMLKELEVLHWDKIDLDGWIDQEAERLFLREGAVMLLYGREPQRVGFLKKVKYAAWSLLNLIKNNGWEVCDTEMPLAGPFGDINVKARADLVLRREREWAVVDLKWRGATRRQRVIRNEEDLQLVLYAKLLNNGEAWAHTAYFVMENGKMIARDNLAFQEINPATPGVDHRAVNERILRRMEATYRWRLEQLRQGRVEVRCRHTYNELEEDYRDRADALLEMKRDDAPYDDYRTLIYLLD
jgi:ATP-dependent helicase/nuclease subunit B